MKGSGTETRRIYTATLTTDTTRTHAHRDKVVGHTILIINSSSVGHTLHLLEGVDAATFKHPRREDKLVVAPHTVS